jgi:hypothetical protein
MRFGFQRIASLSITSLRALHMLLSRKLYMLEPRTGAELNPVRQQAQTLHHVTAILSRSSSCINMSVLTATFA